MQKPPSLRQLLLAELTANADRSRTCTHCSLKFSANSDSSAWKNHFASQHKQRLRDIQLQLNQLRAATAHSDDGGSEIECIDTTSLAAASTVSSAGSACSESTSSSAAAAAAPAKKQKVQHHTQLSIAASFANSASKQSLQLLSRSFTVSSIPHAFVETAAFQSFLRSVSWSGELPTRQSLKHAMLAQADTLRTELSSKVLHNALVSVAVDGWTNVRQYKVTNVVLFVSGVAYYWRSIVNATNRNTADWVAAQLQPILASLIDEHHARVIALVVDNEAVNGATHRLLAQQMPFLVHVPCAAHTIQLVVRSCLKHESLASTVQQLLDLIRHFGVKEHCIALRRIQEARQIKMLAVLKPCDTRWSSMLQAAERMLRLHKEVITCYDCDSLPSVQPDFFDRLATLTAFLKPFQIATDCIQRDTATLYTVYEQFTMLQQHVKEKHAWAAVSILQRWGEHINVDATVACAILSFVRPAANLNIQAAQRFIITFGSAYLQRYQLRGCETPQQIADSLTLQIADFNGREGVFSSLDERIATVQRSAAGWNPRKVWLLYNETALAAVAVAILSISASEAAVERTFSAQALVHSKKRNALHSDTIEAEMMIKFNTRSVEQRATAAASFGQCREQTEDAASDDEGLFGEVDNVSVATEVEEQPMQLNELTDDEELEQVEEPTAQPAAANSKSAAARRAERALKRQSSQPISFEHVDDFIAWFISNKLQSGQKLTKEISNSLAHHSAKLSNSPSLVELEKKLRAALASTNHS